MVTFDAGEPGLIPRMMELGDVGPDQAHTFEGQDNARMALREYANAAWALDAERNALLLGAKASGLSDSEIQALSGVARSTFSKFEELPVAPLVAQETRHAYAALLYQRAKRLVELADATSSRYWRAYLSGYVEVTGGEVEGWEVRGGHDSPYGDRLIHRSIQLRAQVRRTCSYRAAYPWHTRGMDPELIERMQGVEDGSVDAKERIAAELAVLRHGGPAVLAGLFRPEELAEVASIVLDRQRVVYRGNRAVYLDAEGNEITE